MGARRKKTVRLNETDLYKIVNKVLNRNLIKEDEDKEKTHNLLKKLNTLLTTELNNNMDTSGIMVKFGFNGKGTFGMVDNDGPIIIFDNKTGEWGGNTKLKYRDNDSTRIKPIKTNGYVSKIEEKLTEEEKGLLNKVGAVASVPNKSLKTMLTNGSADLWFLPSPNGSQMSWEKKDCRGMKKESGDIDISNIAFTRNENTNNSKKICYSGYVISNNGFSLGIWKPINDVINSNRTS